MIILKDGDEIWAMAEVSMRDDLARWESGQEEWRVSWWHDAEVDGVAWACFGTMEVMKNEFEQSWHGLEGLEWFL